MQEQNIIEKNRGMLLLFIAMAYLFSIGVRMYWPMYFMDNDAFRYAGQLMINTNDGYFFATGARDIIDGVTAQDAQRASAFHVSPGLVLLTAYATKFSPFSLETVTLYLPAIISSLVVIPIVLTGRLLGNTFLGFLSALLGSVAWSYYNRTMTGYYDTDMFAVLLQFTIFYSFLEIVYTKSIKSVILAAVLVFIYPYFYPQGLMIVYAMFILLVFYMILEYKGWIKTNETKKFKDNHISLYGTVILISIALMIILQVEVRILLTLIAISILLKMKLKEKQLLYISLIFFIAFLFLSNVFTVILSNIMTYADRGLDSGSLQFYQVVQTVREAGTIPFSTMANRISGSQIGVIVSLIGYLLLVTRHKQFIIALPLIGIGIFSLVGGLRFTVYAVPVAAISAIYLFHVVTTTISNKKSIYIFAMTLLTASMLYPNITHIIGYKVPTVLNKTEVNDLVKLDKMATDKDYTLAWWDYGYPIWYYSNTNTLIDGGKHTHDNFIISKIMQTSSPQLAANLSRLSVETYVESNYSIVANTLFKNGEVDQIDPNILLMELENGVYDLPDKTRDVFLYFPYRMLNIFPTVAVFGNLDLTTGKTERRITFYPTQATSNKDGILTFRNGIVFDAKQGKISMGKQQITVKNFIVTQLTKEGQTQLQSQMYHTDGQIVVIYMKSYGQFIVLDTQTFNSMYVQMFILEKYDKNLFELVVNSPYSKIYKLKK